MDAHDSSQDSHYNNVQSSHLTVKGTISANKLKKRVGIFNIFGSNKVSWHSPKAELIVLFLFVHF